MYSVLNPRELLRLRGRRAGPKVARTVVLLGLVSLFTDISSEMVTTILPIYLVYTLGFSPLQFGIVDGLQQGAAALVRVAGGFAADRTRRHKDVAVVGYGLSAFARLGLLFVQSLTALSAIVFLDRTGKGIRTAPRDALISLSSDRDSLGLAFGVHRALDTAGAMIGPLIAFGLLWLAPGDFDAVFVVSFCAGLVGLAVLVLFVENRPVPVADAAHVSLGSAAGLLGRRRFATLTLVGGALAIFTVSDGFLFLALQSHLDFEQRLLPLLFVGTAACFMLLAIPVGRIADRFGRGRTFVARLPALARRVRAPARAGLRLARDPALRAAPRPLLRGDGRRPDGPCQRDAPGRAARQRAGAHRDGHEPRPVARFDRLRHDLDMAGRGNGDRGLRRRPHRGDGDGRGSAQALARGGDR